MKLLLEKWRQRLKEYGVSGLVFSRNIPGTVLPDDDEDAQERRELKKLVVPEEKEEKEKKGIRIRITKTKTGGCG